MPRAAGRELKLTPLAPWGECWPESKSKSAVSRVLNQRNIVNSVQTSGESLAKVGGQGLAGLHEPNRLREIRRGEFPPIDPHTRFSVALTARRNMSAPRRRRLSSGPNWRRYRIRGLLHKQWRWAVHRSTPFNGRIE
jgi:hypothetical protein